jgi:four helix bundle protein
MTPLSRNIFKELSSIELRILKMKENIILYKTVNFSVGIRKYCEVLMSKKESAIACQLLRYGMAIGANVAEAQNAESRSDFIHKMKIASKEASETSYWHSICEKMNNFGFQNELTDDLKQIIAILSKIIISAKKNLK